MGKYEKHWFLFVFYVDIFLFVFFSEYIVYKKANIEVDKSFW